jgi:hypothetical protein
MFIEVENPSSLSLLIPNCPQEFHFYPTLGNLPRFADPWSKVTGANKQILHFSGMPEILNKNTPYLNYT